MNSKKRIHKINKLDVNIEKINIFYSYSHEDEELRARFEVHMAGLKRKGMIEEWHDRKIFPGENFESIIDRNLTKADIVIFFVSADFIASDYCHNKEVIKAVQRHNEGLCTVVPIILKDCDWEGSPFESILGLPTNMKPVVSRYWHSTDEAFASIVRELKKIVKKKSVDKNDSSYRKNFAENSHKSIEIINEVKENKENKNEPKKAYSRKNRKVVAHKKVIDKNQSSELIESIIEKKENNINEIHKDDSIINETFVDQEYSNEPANEDTIGKDALADSPLDKNVEDDHLTEEQHIKFIIRNGVKGREFDIETISSITIRELEDELIDNGYLEVQYVYIYILKRTNEILNIETTLADCQIRDDDIILISTIG